MTWLDLLLCAVCAAAFGKTLRGLAVSRALRGFDSTGQRQLVSEALPIELIDAFVSDDEIERLKQLALPNLKASRVLKPGGKAAGQASVRTSSTAFLVGFNLDPIATVVKRKVAMLVGVPISHVENIQVVRYTTGQAYGPHLDAMNLEKFPQEAKKGQRVATVLVYLNDIDNGSGKTRFPRLGVEVTPQRGKALYFRNTSEDGSIDSRSLHEGAPVEGEGIEKWAANIWVRDRPLPLSHR